MLVPEEENLLMVQGCATAGANIPFSSFNTVLAIATDYLLIIHCGTNKILCKSFSE
jgi:hypothetical protein